MNALLYRDNHIDKFDWLPSLAAKLSECASVQIVSRREDLFTQLRLPNAETGLVVLEANSQDALVDFLAVRDAFTEWRLVAILPDSSAETMSLAYRLNPRFVMTPGKPVQWLELVVMQLAMKICVEECE